MAERPTEAVIPGPPEGLNPESRAAAEKVPGFRVALRLPGMTKLRFVANQVIVCDRRDAGPSTQIVLRGIDADTVQPGIPVHPG